MSTLEIILLIVLGIVLLPIIIEGTLWLIVGLALIVLCLALAVWLPFKLVFNAVKR